MKKLIAAMLVISMGVSGGMALAQAQEEVVTFSEVVGMLDEAQTAQPDPDPQQEETPAPLPSPYDEFVVGATSQLSGNFFTGMWGNNTADIDVRTLLHGYSLVVWTQQSLFEFDPQVVNGVQKGVFQEDGNIIYMIALQEGLTYNDGTPIGAADYAFSILLHASPAMAEIGAMTTDAAHIAGYDAYRAGETDVLSGVRIVDALTLTIEIDAEYLPFFYELSLLDFNPYPISVIAPGCEVVDEGKGAVIRNIDTSKTEPLFGAALLEQTVMDKDTGYLSHPAVTTGPYQLESFDWDTREARFTINPYYKGTHDGATPSVDNLVFRAVVPETMMTEYDEGSVQLLNKVVAGENIEEGLKLVLYEEAISESYPRMGFGFLSFACEEGPFASEAVRKAVAHSLDVAQYTSEFSQYAVPVYGYMGVGQWMYQAVEQEGTPAVGSDEDAEAWEALSLEGLNTYPKNVNTAKQLLVDDGWTLNAAGAAFQEGVDTVRRKEIDGVLTPLSVRWAKMEDSVAAQLLDETLVPVLEEIGMEVIVTEKPFVELIEHYYRNGDRAYDMFYLGTNFVSVFDPYFVFNTGDAYQGTQNTTGLRDEKLEALAFDLRSTEPGDLLAYCQKWVQWQTYWNEKLPMLPLYSNLFFDFHVPELKNYRPDSEMSWAKAIVYAYYEGMPPAWMQTETPTPEPTTPEPTASEPTTPESVIDE